MVVALDNLLDRLIRPLPLALVVAMLNLMLPWPRPARLISASSLPLLALLRLPATGLRLRRRLEPPRQVEAITNLEPADGVMVLALIRLAARQVLEKTSSRTTTEGGVRLTPVACPELRLPRAASQELLCRRLAP